MDYPKPLMRKSELIAIGFSERYLERVFRTPGQKVAHKINPGKINSPLVFDTFELEKFRQKEMRLSR
mgnify:FL=1